MCSWYDILERDVVKQPSFEINWGSVPDDERFSADWQVYALWPAPVNDDACFAAAGFSYFHSKDENWVEQYWDEQAELLTRRLLEIFSGIGKPNLLSQALLSPRAVLKFWAPRVALSLIEQLRQPIQWDSLPEVTIRFGHAAELRAGNGHELYWIALAPSNSMTFDTVLMQISDIWPIRQVQLDWRYLGVGQHTFE